MNKSRLISIFLSLIWIFLGITMLIFGANNYLKYSEIGILWFMEVWEFYSIEYYIFGIYSVLIGFIILLNRSISNLLTIFAYCIVTSFLGVTIHSCFTFFDFYYFNNLYSNIILLALIFISYKFYEKIVDVKAIINMLRHRMTIKLLLSIIVFLTMLTISIVFNYSYFKYPS